MPDISKINALAIGSVSKVDGLAKASILDIDGVAVPSAFTGLLDETYGSGASAAYSVRQLKSGITVAMRVRRDTAGGTGDDDEADVSFDTSLTDPAISLDSAVSSVTSSATTLGEFLNVGTVNGTTYTNPDSLSGTASCFVDEWKDQSGNAAHAEQATFGNQPQIHSGTVNTDLISENGKPALDYTASNSILLRNSSFSISQPATVFVTGQGSTANRNFMDGVGSSGNRLTLNTYNGYAYYAGNNNVQIQSTLDSNQHLFYVLFDGASSEGGIDAGTAVSGNAGTNSLTGLTVGNDIQDNASCNGSMQEFIIYASDRSGNRTSIETNMNGFFGIY